MQLRQRRVDVSLHREKDNMATFFWCFRRDGKQYFFLCAIYAFVKFTWDLSLLIDSKTLNLSKSFPSSCAQFLRVHLT